jgi:hypothetical protein
MHDGGFFVVLGGSKMNTYNSSCVVAVATGGEGSLPNYFDEMEMGGRRREITQKNVE